MIVVINERLVMYYVYDETGDLMRKVRYRAEAIALVSIREGWTYKYIKPKKKIYQFEEAPF